MRRVIIPLLFAFALSMTGCATSHYGNFVKAKQSNINQHEIATDVADKLTELYPPAKVRFDLQQTVKPKDSFGTELIQILRGRGYALLEFDPKSELTSSGIPLRYVFDQFSGTDIYRVSIFIGDKTLTRAYLQENGSVIPAGYWVREQ